MHECEGSAQAGRRLMRNGFAHIHVLTGRFGWEAKLVQGVSVQGVSLVRTQKQLFLLMPSLRENETS